MVGYLNLSSFYRINSNSVEATKIKILNLPTLQFLVILWKTFIEKNISSQSDQLLLLKDRKLKDIFI